MGQERTVRDTLKASQVYSYIYFRHAPCLTDFTFEFIRRPTPLILSPSYWTFVELTLVTDGMYQIWSTFVKTSSNPTTEKKYHFGKCRKACQKDVERAFGVLQ
jgi:hypothetical protein